MSSPGPWGQPPKRKTPRLGLYLWLGALALIGVAVLLLDRLFPTGDSPWGDPALVRTVGFLALVSSSLLFVREFKFKQTARNVLGWVAVGAVLIIGFSFQEELRAFGLRLRSNLMPGYAVETGLRELTLSEGEGGHYNVYGTVNGTRIAFLIDTGATDIVLDPADAKRAGIDLSNLKFDRPFGSANGIGYGAKTTVENLSVGPIVLTNVEVSINNARMGSSLLGMAFLKRLKSFSVSGQKLTLHY
ncbi:MAG TPA: TIGR02281 family clan AA aspartic protease [Rhizomicrobium sp.]|nr:TIGR02281 family clan AA aspartic protease [Rhizomicrobium sp.]